MNGVILGGLILLVVAYAFIGKYLAAQKKLFTQPKEGTGEFVMSGEEVVRAIIAWKGRVLRLTDFEVIEEDEVEEEDQISGDGIFHYLNPLNWLEPLGIYWVGLYPFYKIYAYNFDWTEEVTKADGSVEIKVRHAREGEGNEGKTTFIKLVSTPYVFTLTEVKTSEQIPLKIVVVVTVRVRNPYKALFDQNDWLKSTQGSVNGSSIGFCGNRKYAELTADKGALATELKKLGNEILDDQAGIDLFNEAGIEIVDVQIRTIEFADAEAKEKYQNLATAVYEAEQNAEALLKKTKAEKEATILRAEGDAQAVKIAAEAERNRIEKEYGPIAGDDKDKRMQIRQLEAYEKAGANGGTTVIASNEAFGLVTATLQGGKQP